MLLYVRMRSITKAPQVSLHPPPRLSEALSGTSGCQAGVCGCQACEHRQQDGSINTGPLKIGYLVPHDLMAADIARRINARMHALGIKVLGCPSEAH